MKRLLLLLLLIAPFARAATVPAASCSTADVQTAVTAASTGDTVTIPAGTCTWTSGITISGKSLNIVGAGSGRIIALDNGTEVLTIGTGALTVNIAMYSPGFSSASITPGETLRIFQNNSRDNWMQGTVTSITGNVLVMNITSTNGTSTTHRWLIATVPTTVIINNSSSTLFSITEDTALHTSISGIQFSVGTVHACCSSSMVGLTYASGGQAILIHDNWFQHGTGAVFSIQGNTNRGVIYRNSFDGSSYSNGTLATTGAFRTKIDSPASGQNAWVTASFWGTLDTTGQNNLYAETNDFHAFQALTDNDDNARTVLRYNLIDSAIFATHGADTSPYGQRYFEYYNNVGNWNGYGDGTTFNPANGWIGFVRGGSAVVHDNTLPPLAFQDFTKSDFELTVFNLQEGANNPSDACWGAGFTNGAKYHAPRQVGFGRVTGTGTDGLGRSSDETTYVGDSEPLYIWNNNRTFTVATPDFGGTHCTNPDFSRNYIVVNRDYFFSAKPSYTPFTYPHPLTSSAAAPILSFSPMPAAFGNQNINTTSAAITITISNVGNATETYTSLALSPSVYARTGGTCTIPSGTIAASGSCTVIVTFTPTAVQTYNGSLTMTGTVTAAGALTGSGTNAISIPAAPTNLTAGVTGSTVNLTWTASTGTPSGYNVLRGTVTGGPYSIIATLGTVTTYADTSLANGSYFYRVNAFNSAGTSPNSNEASATVATACSINLTPSSLNFGVIQLGTSSATQDITVKNNGTASCSSLVINNPSGPNAADFGQTNGCGGTLAINATCTVTVTFTPSLTGAESASLVVTSTDPNSPDSASLSGTGAQPVSVSPSSLGFGRVQVNKTSSAQVVTFTNSSGGAVTISTAITGGDSTQFTKGTDTCTGSIANLATCTVSITGTPTSTGSKTSALVLTFTGASGSPISVPLTENAVTHKVRKGVIL